MVELIRLELPWPPTTNKYWRHAKVGRDFRTLISRAGREYHDAVASVVKINGQDVSLTGRLSVTLNCFPPDRRRRDLDNLLKALLDSLTRAGVWEDDSQIDRLVVSRRECVPGGRINITIEQCGKVHG